MTKKERRNNGELPQYYIERAHRPIVRREVFEEVQSRLNRPFTDNASHNTFANQLFCGDCGGKYGRKIVGSYRDNKKYRHPVWKCNRRYDQAEKCQTPHLYEEVIAHAFNEAVQWLLRNNPSLVDLCYKPLFSSIRAAKSVSKAERKQMIADYIPEFLEASPKEIPFAATAWRVIIERADITRDRKMILQFIDGSKYVYIIPHYSSIRRKDLLK